ncbi:Cytochrome c oxidase assembly protein cox11, mitochondrial [Sorochytrium milnesiophthora]
MATQLLLRRRLLLQLASPASIYRHRCSPLLPPSRYRSTASSSRSNDTKNDNVLYYSAAVFIGFIGLSYCSVPLYRMFCSATGVGGTVQTSLDDTFSKDNMRPVPRAKRIRITFNSDTSRSLNWSFRPQQREVMVVPGETALAFYTAKNKSDVDVTGISTYNVIPPQAGPYFNKIQCFCLAAGSMVAGVDGLGRRIEDAVGARLVLTYAEEPAGNGVVAGTSNKLLEQGAKSCVAVTLEDGRTLVCTDDHRLLTTRGWLAARDVPLNDDLCRVLCGPDAVLDVPDTDEVFALELANLGRTLTLANNRDACFAFVRLLGLTLSQGCIHKQVLLLDHQLDVDAALYDLGVLEVASSVAKGTYQVALSEALSRDLLAHSGQGTATDVPAFITAASTPQCVKREFLAAFFGGCGEAPALSTSGANVWFEEIQLPVAVARRQQKKGETLLRALQEVLSRDFGFATGAIDAVRSEKAGNIELRLRLAAYDTPLFAERIGFRYASVKTMRLTVAASWYRMHQGVKEIRSAFPLVATHHSRLVAPRRLYSTLKLADWLAAVGARGLFSGSKPEQACSSVPAMHLKLTGRAAIGVRPTYDLSVPRTHAFLANGLVVHNCFEEQKLRAGEEVDMPVFFFIDPEFAEDPNMQGIDEIMLSYTFFNAKTAKLQGIVSSATMEAPSLSTTAAV